MNLPLSRATRQVHVTPTAPKVATTLRDAGPDDAFADERVVRAVRYAGDDAGLENAHGMELEACAFQGARLAGELGGTTIDNCAFDSSDLSNLRADETSVIESALLHSRLTGMSLTGGIVRDVTFGESRADLTVFRYTKFRTVVFTDCNLTGADFQNATFRNVRFEHCDLTGAQFGNATVEQNASFVDCKLSDLSGVRGLRGARVQGEDLLGLAECLAREMGIDVSW